MQAKLESIVDALPTLVAYIDAEQRYQFVNAAYERWFGIPRAEIVGRHVEEVLGVEGHRAIRPHLEQALAGQLVRHEAEVAYRSGGTRFIEATYVPQVAADGRIVGCVSLVADVGERRSLERFRDATAERSERLLKITAAIAEAVTASEVFEAAVDHVAATVGASSAGLWLVSEDGATAQLVRSQGYLEPTRQRLQELRLDAAVSIPAIDCMRRGEPVWMASQHELLQHYPHLASLVTPGRSYRVSCLPLIARGRTLGALGLTIEEARESSADERSFLMLVARYTSQAVERLRLLEAEGRRREEALAAAARAEQLLAELHETIRYNETFAGILAHDLRNPLGAMMTAAQVLLRRQEGGGDRMTKPLSRILSSGERMVRMIEQLLDLTRARVGGGFELHPQEASLAELCIQVMDELELVYPEWKLRREVLGDPSGTWDPDRLLQVVSNLVANAGMHGTPAGIIDVRIDGTSPDAVVLEVHNDGAIPEALLPSIFDPFRGTRHRREQSRGLGLGLFITQQIVMAHGGTIELCSSSAEGTTFLVRLPRWTTAPLPR